MLPLERRAGRLPNPKRSVSQQMRQCPGANESALAKCSLSFWRVVSLHHLPYLTKSAVPASASLPVSAAPNHSENYEQRKQNLVSSERDLFFSIKFAEEL